MSRILGPVVQALVAAVLDPGHQLLLGGRIARQLVRDHDPRRPSLLLQQLAQQALGGPLVAPALSAFAPKCPGGTRCRSFARWWTQYLVSQPENGARADRTGPCTKASTRPRACPQLSQTTAAARWMAPRKWTARLS